MSGKVGHMHQQWCGARANLNSTTTSIVGAIELLSKSKKYASAEAVKPLCRSSGRGANETHTYIDRFIKGEPQTNNRELHLLVVAVVNDNDLDSSEGQRWPSVRRATLWYKPPAPILQTVVGLVLMRGEVVAAAPFADGGGLGLVLAEGAAGAGAAAAAAGAAAAAAAAT